MGENDIHLYSPRGKLYQNMPINLISLISTCISYQWDINLTLKYKICISFSYQATFLWDRHFSFLKELVKSHGRYYPFSLSSNDYNLVLCIICNISDYILMIFLRSKTCLGLSHLCIPYKNEMISMISLINLLCEHMWFIMVLCRWSNISVYKALRAIYYV